jgi:hypothetical protein
MRPVVSDRRARTTTLTMGCVTGTISRVRKPEIGLTERGRFPAFRRAACGTRLIHELCHTLPDDS